MKLTNIQEIKPNLDQVLVKILDVRKDTLNGYIFEQKKINKYVGEVLAIGPTATDNENCPELKVGDYVIFSEFAGYHIRTEGIVKIIKGYDIMMKIEEIGNISESTLTPTADRLLLEVHYTDIDSDGLITGDETDPRENDLSYGVILKTGPACKLGMKVGQMVAFPPYAGETIKEAPKPGIMEYRSLVELDALFTV